MKNLEGSLKEAAGAFPGLSKMYDVYLASEKLGLHTRVDCILIDEARKQAWPLQVKWAKRPRKIYTTQRLQVLMEAALIEDQLGYKVPNGFIKFLKTGDIVTISTNDRSQLLQALALINGITTEEKLPKPTMFEKRCTDCCYRRECWV